MAHDFVRLVNCWPDLPASGAGTLGCSLLPLDAPVPIDSEVAFAPQPGAGKLLFLF